MTLTSFPGAFFIVSAAITVPVLLIFAWFYMQVRRDQLIEDEQSMKKIGVEEGHSVVIEEDQDDPLQLQLDQPADDDPSDSEESSSSSGTSRSSRSSSSCSKTRY